MVVCDNIAIVGSKGSGKMKWAMDCVVKCYVALFPR